MQHINEKRALKIKGNEHANVDLLKSKNRTYETKLHAKIKIKN